MRFEELKTARDRSSGFDAELWQSGDRPGFGFDLA